MEEILKSLTIIKQELTIIEKLLQNQNKELSDAELAKEILKILPVKYENCDSLELQKLYHNNKQPKLYINKDWIVIKVFDDSKNLIGTHKLKYKKLRKFHDILHKKGINKHHESKDPEFNYLPYEVTLELKEVLEE